jgi:nicotinamidase-related amidase
LSTIDANAALIVIDLQKGVVALPSAHPMDDVVRNAAALADAFRSSDLPVVLVRATGVAPGRTDVSRPAIGERPPDWADPVEDLAATEQDIVITKERWGAFHDTQLDAELRRRGVSQVVLAGVATSIGVESTARAAHEHGYHVVLATDAMTDRDLDAHDNSVQRIFPRLGETATSEEILAALRVRR